MKGLVFFDYDGTLVDERDKIYKPTERTLEAINRLQQGGYLCVLATGRPHSYIPQGAKEIGLDGYITSNGACVNVHGEEILRDVYDDEELKALLDDFKQYEVNFILENTELCYVKNMKDPNYVHFLKNFNTPTDNFVAYENFEQVRHKVEKITCVFQDEDHLRRYYNKVKDNYAIGMHRNCNTFDLVKKHIHKGRGVCALIEHYNVSKRHTYAFGDGDNDVELLSSVHCGIAMGIHDSVLDPVADMVTSTVKEEGIYEALKKLEVI